MHGGGIELLPRHPDRAQAEEMRGDIHMVYTSAHWPAHAGAARIAGVRECKAPVQLDKLVGGGGGEAVVPDKRWNGGGKGGEMRRVTLWGISDAS
jgi:hypothetical protein